MHRSCFSEKPVTASAIVVFLCPRALESGRFGVNPNLNPTFSMTELHVYCQAGARHTQVEGWHDGRLKIRLKARPVEGRANRALVDWLSDRLGCMRGQVVLISGEKSRYKTILIEGHGPEEVLARLSSMGPPALSSHST
jgi:uncharacterized protein (TIGR00251 family)